MKSKAFIIKLFALFSVVRAYNLIILALAQYLAVLFIFAQDRPHLEVLLDPKFNGIVFVSLLCVAAGYIINNFYDLEKDQIDRPMQTYLNRQVSQQFKLYTYLALNSFGLIIAFMVSWRVFIFFLVYQFLVWFYSHKINRIVFINNLYSVILRTFPFFALMIYYENFSSLIFFHAFFLMSLLLTMEIIKDIVSRPADIIYGYQSLATNFPEKTVKKILSGCMLLSILLAFVLLRNEQVGHMSYYLYFTILFFLFTIIVLWRIKSNIEFRILLFFIKAIIVIGVLSIVFIGINPMELAG